MLILWIYQEFLLLLRGSPSFLRLLQTVIPVGSDWSEIKGRLILQNKDVTGSKRALDAPVFKESASGKGTNIARKLITSSLSTAGLHDLNELHNLECPGAWESTCIP